MTKVLRLLLLLCLAALALPAAAQTFPPLTGRVVDGAKLLSPQQVQQLTDLSAQVEAASARQLVVATSNRLPLACSRATACISSGVTFSSTRLRRTCDENRLGFRKAAKLRQLSKVLAAPLV